MEFNIVKKQLTLTETLTFVDEVVKSAFQADKDGNLGEYSPILKEIAMKYYFLKYYTDFPLSDDMEKDYAQYADLYLMYYHINDSISHQFVDIDHSINKRIEQILKDRRAFIAASSVNSLTENLEPAINKMTDLLEKEAERTKAEKELAESADRLSKAQAKQIEYTNKVNDLLTPEEQAAISKKYAGEDIDFADLQKDIVNNFFKSDSHKENLAEIFDDAKKTITEQKETIQKLNNEISARKVVAHPTLK